MEKQFTVRTKGNEVGIVEYVGIGGEIEIPDVIDGMPVTAILEGAFFSRTCLKSVIIPATITSIGEGAFSYCSSLTLVTIRGNVTRIGHYAFAYCTSLSSIVFMGDLPPLVGENWIEEAPAEIRGHAYAASHFPDPGSAFSDLTMGVAIAPIAQSPGRGAIVSSDFPDQAPAKKLIVKRKVIVNRKDDIPQDRPPPSPRANLNEAAPLPQQRTHCPWCGADTYGSQNCDFCGAKRGR
jgi:hypothetical protein